MSIPQLITKRCEEGWNTPESINSASPLLPLDFPHAHKHPGLHCAMESPELPQAHGHGSRGVCRGLNHHKPVFSSSPQIPVCPRPNDFFSRGQTGIYGEEKPNPRQAPSAFRSGEACQASLQILPMSGSLADLHSRETPAHAPFGISACFAFLRLRAFSTSGRCSSAHWQSADSGALRVSPRGVNSYSVRGGTSG